MSERPDGRRRRQRTRGSMVLAVLVLAGLLAGTELLLRAKPTLEVSELQVDGVPALDAPATDGACRRGVDDEPHTDPMRPFRPGGRVSADQIHACPQAYDGHRVRYAGEAVGDLLRRDGGAWVQVNDDDYALQVGPLGRHEELRGFNTGIPVWLPDPLPDVVGDVGRPGRRGDVLLIDGVVRRADPDDGGSLTLRADRVEVLAPAVDTPEPLHTVQAIVAAVLAVAAAGALLWARRTRAR
ncbi:hypothetical protein FTX61_14270 [Nitriliruptoraceae bacterium ZYF776]|nr:hypothetical protein [Profundirhabdus halotolerans]